MELTWFSLEEDILRLDFCVLKSWVFPCVNLVFDASSYRNVFLACSGVCVSVRVARSSEGGGVSVDHVDRFSRCWKMYTKCAASELPLGRVQDHY